MPASSWSRYNRALTNRGSLDIYLGDDIERRWHLSRSSGLPGRPEVYPDSVILLGLVLQQVYRLPLRQTVGLLRSVLRLAGLGALTVPDPSTLCRRRTGLVLPDWPKAGAVIVIVAGIVTPCSKHDSEVLPAVLADAEPAPGCVFIADGAYDRRTCYESAKRHKGRLLTPPSKRAVLHDEPAWTERNRAIEEARFLGKDGWKRSVGYGRRSLAESAMHRLKASFGQRLRSRSEASQTPEALLRAHILNSWPTPKRFAA